MSSIKTDLSRGAYTSLRNGVPNPPLWNATTYQPAYHLTFALPDGTSGVRLVAAANISESNLAILPTGASCIDTVSISGDPAPEPASLALRPATPGQVTSGKISLPRRVYDTDMDSTSGLRSELDRLLSGKGAHADFAQAVTNFPAALRGVRQSSSPHSGWELLEHLRIAQWDMLEFSRNPAHVSPPWPEGYWPQTTEPPDDAAWQTSIRQFESDLAAMRALIADPAADLFTPFAHGEGQSLLREALQMADHNAYHIGELVLLRRLLNAWP